jgi:hypothetical protein
MKTFAPHFAAAIAALTLAASSASAEEGVAIERPAERQNSVNVSPLGLIIGSYAANYERLLPGGHGFIVEGAYSRSSDSESSATSGGVGLGYRYHWRGRQNSGFVGATLGYYVGNGDATVTTNNMSETFDVDTKVLTMTANIGKRWAWDSGLNVTLRFGAGYGNYSVSTDSTDPDAQDAVELVDDLLQLIPVALDGELSIGYTF